VSGQQVGYTRVSSLDQNPDRQLDGVAVDRTFTDSASGRSTARPQLEAMLAFVRHRDQPGGALPAGRGHRSERLGEQLQLRRARQPQVQQHGRARPAR